MSGMYMPGAFALEDRVEILGVVRQAAFGHLVTHTETEGAAAELKATALPFVVDEELSTVRAHFARANNHWKSIDGTDALLIVPSADAYVSPRWYPSKAEHGKVVPTWNYEVIHLYGTIKIHDDAEWKLKLVEELTDLNERQAVGSDEEMAWRVSDAPADFIAGQLKAIVGVELNISLVEAKRKLSQNRPEADRLGVAGALSRSERRRDRDTAALMDSPSLS